MEINTTATLLSAYSSNETNYSSPGRYAQWGAAVYEGKEGEEDEYAEDRGGARPMPDYAKAVVTFLYASVVFVAIGGNLVVCSIVVTQKRMRTVTNYFIVSLACSDILMASLCIPFTFVSNVLFHYWPFGAVLCPVVLYAQVVSVFLSAFTMLAISIDRYRAVIFPLKPRLTTRISVLIILVTWLLSLSVSLPVAIFSRTSPRSAEVTSGDEEEEEEEVVCDEAWPSDDQRYAYSVSVMVLQYFLPLSILSFTYISIGIVIWVKKAPGEAENNRDRRMAAAKRKMVKMMITVVVIYAVCWLPIHAITLIGDARPDIWQFRHIQSVWIACHWAAMSSCCYNPIVYCWMNPKFRNGFRYVFRFCPGVVYDPILTAAAPSRGSVHCSYVTTMALHNGGGGVGGGGGSSKRRGSLGMDSAHWTKGGGGAGRKRGDARTGLGGSRVIPFWDRFDHRRRRALAANGRMTSSSRCHRDEEFVGLSLRDIRTMNVRRLIDSPPGTTETRFCSDSEC